MPKTESKQRYRITNWAEYNRSLIERGSVTIWIDDDAAKKWLAPKEKGVNGRPKTYSDEAILIALTLRMVFKLPLRALEGFLKSLIILMHVALPVPSYSQISRRAGHLGKELRRLSRKRPTDVVFDSTGLKVYGEGEWKVRTHGTSKRRTWRKLHLAIDPRSGEILVAELTDNSRGDAQVAEGMMDKVHGNVQRVYGDGAYDSHDLRKKIAAKKAEPKIPPPRNAVPGDPADEATRKRNEAISAIRALGGDDDARALWKKLERYHTRSLVETTMFRFKTIFGGDLRSRTWENQRIEAYVKCLVLNKMTKLGMPIGYWEEVLETTG
jgi:IS5 family transposase